MQETDKQTDTITQEVDNRQTDRQTNLVNFLQVISVSEQQHDEDVSRENHLQNVGKEALVRL